ncbi:hypothetical protein GCM10010298_07120 [Streptomyces microflavus]|uniref:Uncharacterized protein n=1 Tax=Streptomyces microflavus TaxID=1919 RepID=A0A7J0CM43_STRMI|nr:hypothetical protein Smic_21060 [Streptomyces microflavus]GGX46310.1 hypothetical protein GCM10010298_07120 [Streptomyces microflavus]
MRRAPSELAFELKEIITLLETSLSREAREVTAERICDWCHSFDRREVRVVAALLSSAVAVEPERGCRESELNALSELTASGLVEAEDLASLRELRRDLLTEPDAEHYDYLVGE